MTRTEKALTGAQREGEVNTLRGAGGLVPTIDDYWRFAEMLRAGGACGNHHRIISPRTLEFMRNNHLLGEIASTESWAETSFFGVGFGLMGSVILDPVRAQTSASVGDYGWGGAAGSYFWVSPRDDLVVVFFTQLKPTSALPIRKGLRALAHQALAD